MRLGARTIERTAYSSNATIQNQSEIIGVLTRMRPTRPDVVPVLQ